MKKITYFFSCLLIGLTGFSQEIVPAGTSIDDPVNNTFYYGFESAGATAKWVTDQTNLWSISTDKKARGNNSLKLLIENATSSAIKSIVTPYTISKVRSAKVSSTTSFVIASSYEGRLLGINYQGGIVWDIPLIPSGETKPAGTANNDIFCADLNNDGFDEVLAANADGVLYCVDAKTGNILWDTKSIPEINNVTPMYAVCAVKKEGVPYVACGNYDNSLYYLNANGSFNKEIKSSTYSRFKVFGSDLVKEMFSNNLHMANFLRPIPLDDNNDRLGMLATNNHMQVNGVLYQFEPLADLPIQITGAKNNEGVTLKTNKPVGDMRVVKNPVDNKNLIILGNSAQNNDSGVFTCNPDIDNYTSATNIDTETINGVLIDLKAVGYSDTFGYRVAQTELANTNTGNIYLTVFGSEIIIQDATDLSIHRRLKSTYSYNDMWKDELTGNILLAGSQSGGSCVHIVNTMDTNWEQEYVDLVPPGKISTLLANVNTIKNQVSTFVKPSYEIHDTPNNVIFATGLSSKSTNATKTLIQDLEALDPVNGPKALGYVFSQKYRVWDRASDITSVTYQEKRDRRFTYIEDGCDQTEDPKCQKNYDAVTTVRIDALNDNPNGVAFWGGHGNDPSPFSQSDLRTILEADVAKKKILIYPELEGSDEEFSKFLESYMYEIADTIQKHNLNTNIHIRTKHTFWQGIIHLPLWNKIMSGEYADLFVPSMEETTDKSMELSVAARMGVWMSGAFNNWGSRSVNDNLSYDRARQHAHAKAKNHVLRQTLYNLSCGATHFNNIDTFDTEAMQLIFEMVAKGAIYVPAREDLLSISPVHLSIVNPDMDYIHKSSSVKFTVNFDKDLGEEKFVFGRLSAPFAGAKNTEYDFSTYAAGANDRRLNFIPRYNNGLVLITPPNITGADMPVRGVLEDHMHPFYAGKTKEYFTDGKKYYSDMEQTSSFEPDSNYYLTIKNDIEASADLLPLKVSGDVAWVVAQTDKNHLRLTLVDNGFVNPKGGTAKVKINTSEISVSNITNILDTSETYSGSDEYDIEIPLGGFKFLDITLTNEYY